MEARVRTVGMIVGSLRKGSFSRRLAGALTGLAPASLDLSIIEIGALPLYNQDFEAAPPETWQSFRRETRAADALLFITPEYNRSIPAPLKNAIDVGSRPKGASAFDGKAAAVISCSPGVLGGFGANHHLRQCLMCLNVATLPAPEIYLGGVDKLVNDQGAIAADSTRELLTTFLQRFAAWVERNGRFAAG